MEEPPALVRIGSKPRILFPHGVLHVDIKPDEMLVLVPNLICNFIWGEKYFFLPHYHSSFKVGAMKPRSKGIFVALVFSGAKLFSVLIRGMKEHVNFTQRLKLSECVF